VRFLKIKYIGKSFLINNNKNTHNILMPRRIADYPDAFAG
jgi:hypothetical protein